MERETKRERHGVRTNQVGFGICGEGEALGVYLFRIVLEACKRSMVYVSSHGV
jgi:hypothetical protein